MLVCCCGGFCLVFFRPSKHNQARNRNHKGKEGGGNYSHPRTVCNLVLCNGVIPSMHPHGSVCTANSGVSFQEHRSQLAIQQDVGVMEHQKGDTHTNNTDIGT